MSKVITKKDNKRGSRTKLVGSGVRESKESKKKLRNSIKNLLLKSDDQQPPE